MRNLKLGHVRNLALVHRNKMGKSSPSSPAPAGVLSPHGSWEGPPGATFGLTWCPCVCSIPAVFLLIWASCQDVLEWSQAVTPLELPPSQTSVKMVAHKLCSGNLSWRSAGHIWLTWLRALRNRSQSPCGWRVCKPVLSFVSGTSSCVTLSMLLTLSCVSFSSSAKCEAWWFLSSLVILSYKSDNLHLLSV